MPFKNDSVQEINLVPNLTKPNTNEQQHGTGMYLNSILNFILLLYFKYNLFPNTGLKLWTPTSKVTGSTD